ncbi:MAG TPA: HAD hydrolase-like protein [Gammaproteobacteria bacterium]|nr:HAD hydrolase-like protein [Gammaproteobacteria bacterium]
MNLIIFDIDGTLTQTNEMDSTCFAQAIEDALQIKGLNTDWASYRYSTDSGLLKEIYESFFKREPTKQEVISIQERFVTYLNNAWTVNRALITPIPGADTLFQKIDSLAVSSATNPRINSEQLIQN